MHVNICFVLDFNERRRVKLCLVNTRVPEKNEIYVYVDISSCISQNTAEEMSEIDRDPWKDSVQSYNRPINPAPGEYPSPRKKCKISLVVFNMLWYFTAVFAWENQQF